MMAEIEALRHEIAPEIPEYALTFEQLVEAMGPKAKENRLHDWLSAEIKAGRWKKARAAGAKAKTVYWKAVG
jgi:hypothetical protein